MRGGVRALGSPSSESVSRSGVSGVRYAMRRARYARRAMEVPRPIPLLQDVIAPSVRWSSRSSSA